ncbi:MAG: hypothetical protein LKF87_11255 [Clostridium tyrobutyricum]|uniref:hypothetical protein n=1 Tax=Clostridium tyrobutyricum TaxID=1519 RepID=UPI0024314C5A|nr:hypothetical protein [Clostridium tyrobutyricum]MCH4200932.1 hypothetical protein [Clostridium tyrobutyricum]MCH4236463.1 hypothetical protein [Clostridium tyrobutyricum]MCH4259517.1 hypothetical protein [Clostridium tyrobutyricum]
MKINKKRGSIQLLPLFFILLMLVGVVSLLLYETVIANDKYSRFKNQLDSTNLAIVRNVNQETLSRENKLIFEEYNIPPVFETYKEYLIENFNLDPNLKSLPENKSIIGEVIIKDLRIYSVKDGVLDEWDYTGGTFNHISNPTCKTPNGVKVEQTSVYSKINLSTYTVFRLKSTGKNIKNLDIESYTDFIKSK